jgi:hypothetical protein
MPKLSEIYLPLGLKGLNRSACLFACVQQLRCGEQLIRGHLTKQLSRHLLFIGTGQF